MKKIINTKNEKKMLASSFRWIGEDKRGFTLLELLISVFIFSLVMVIVTSLFTRIVAFNKRSRSIQQNMEDVRFAMELMAKTVRTSSVVSCNNFNHPICNAQESSIEVYDYSQNKCIRFYLKSKRIRMDSAATDRANCRSGVTLTGIDLVDNFVMNLDFRATKTDNASSQVGKVTISAEVCSTASCTGVENDRANLETTLSLRDYL